ncbi:hypothetical protein RDI58_013676 [Solanum bulbocastanum]|uniref:Uncharacterized protein n=1 Tax=Solanum bulbocastanum TaxID=147425 RepID=A0AAN8TU15_SOLBU
METRRPNSIGAQQPETLGQDDDDLSESEEGIQELEEEIRELQQQVQQMAEKIVDFRTTLPGQLKTTLDSILTAQRPLFDSPESQPGCSNQPPTSAFSQSEVVLHCLQTGGVSDLEDSLVKILALLVEALKNACRNAKIDVEEPGDALPGEVQKEAEKVQLLKQKITSNASAIPIVLNRMKEGMAKIDKLQSSNKVIHPAFKRGRTCR